MAENKGKNRKSTPESLNESKRKSTYAEMTKKKQIKEVSVKRIAQN